MTAPRGGGSLAEPEQQETPGETSGVSRNKIRLAIAGVVVLAVLALTLVTLLAGSSPTASNAPGFIKPGATIPGVQSAGPIIPIKPLSASAPLRMSYPAIKASSSLVGVGTDAQNHMQVPPVSQPQQAAWYNRAPTPGALGPSVVLGHVNGDGKQGVFSELSKAQRGQLIDIDRADGTTAIFTVYDVQTVPKDKFPTQDVYGNVPDAQIRLITCGGDLDRAAHNYLSNVIVYGVLTGVKKT